MVTACREEGTGKLLFLLLFLLKFVQVILVKCVNLSSPLSIDMNDTPIDSRQ